jgi:protein SCO1
MSRKSVFYLVFFLCLVAAFLLALRLINNGEVLEKRHKVIAEVQPFTFTDQSGRIVTEKDIAGKVVLVEFFFTTCTTICPDMNRTMKGIYEQFKNEKDFLVLSHTSDPKNDSPERLKRYADSIGAGPNWWFLTGRKDSLYSAARISYAVDDQKIPAGDSAQDFIHTQLFALVHKDGVVRKKVYDSFNDEEMKELVTDIKKALKK